MLVALLIIPLSQFVIHVIGKSIRRKARRNTRQIGGILSIITENFSSIRILKAFAVEKYESNRFNENLGNISTYYLDRQNCVLCPRLSLKP